MSGLKWDDVVEWFDPELNGTLPDASVPSTTVADWQLVLTLIRARGWGYAYEVDGQQRRMPVRAEEILADPEPTIKVWPVPGMLAIFRFYSAESIDFDVDLRELQGQDRLDDLCRFLRVIGRAVRKPVTLAAEGSPGVPFLEYQVDADEVVLVG